MIECLMTGDFINISLRRIFVSPSATDFFEKP
jgi:hypothetical protein